jgi:PAS domain S-box-containing protein
MIEPPREFEIADWLASEARLAAILSLTPYAVISVDEEQRICLFNRGAEAIFGHAAAEALGQPLEMLMPARFRKVHREHFNVFAGGPEVSRAMGKRGEFPALRKDGTEFPAEASILKLESGGRAIFTSLVRDITERKEREQAASRLAAIVESSSDAIVGETLDGTVVYWNPAAERLFGYSAEEIEGRSIEFLAPPDRPQEISRTIASIRRGEHVESYETQRRRKDGSLVDVFATASPIRDGSGRITGISVIYRDITEQKKVRARLLQAQKLEAAGQLTAGLVHDFNNLMAIILANGELLRNRLGEDDEKLQAIIRAALRSAELTRRLLTFSGQHDYRPQDVDLSHLVARTTEMLRHSLGESIELHAVSAPGLWRAMADPGQVENAVLNLALNARDAMPQGGRLTIETGNARFDPAFAATHPDATAGDYVMLSVSDSGVGMPPEVLERAFEPFFTTKPVGSGTGLGLSAVYGTVKQGGGWVVIDSAEGRGTTLRLYLPRAELAA